MGNDWNGEIHHFMERNVYCKLNIYIYTEKFIPKKKGQSLYKTQYNAMKYNLVVIPL